MHVIATAGHVDHGKSTLIRALTGIEALGVEHCVVVITRADLADPGDRPGPVAASPVPARRRSS